MTYLRHYCHNISTLKIVCDDSSSLDTKIVFHFSALSVWRITSDVAERGSRIVFSLLPLHQPPSALPVHPSNVTFNHPLAAKLLDSD